MIPVPRPVNATEAAVVNAVALAIYAAGAIVAGSKWGWRRYWWI